MLNNNINTINNFLESIISKILYQNFNLAFWFYFPNIILVCTDIGLYFRNRKLEQNEE